MIYRWGPPIARSPAPNLAQNPFPIIIFYYYPSRKSVCGKIVAQGHALTSFGTS
jgi:hypothetical protein